MSKNLMLDDFTQQEIRLAREIANALNDLHSLQLHLQLVRTCREAFLRKHLNHVLALPEEQIKKNRAALYVYLVKQGIRHGDSWY